MTNIFCEECGVEVDDKVEFTLIIDAALLTKTPPNGTICTDCAAKFLAKDKTDA